MQRFICFGVALAVFAPVIIGDAEAAPKKRKKSQQVAGFVQFVPVGGTLRSQNRFGERRINGYTDNTRQFFAAIANNQN